MGIQGCKNCGRKFNYIDLQKSFWSGYRPIICRTCGARHIWKMSYRIIIVILIVLPLFFSRNNVTRSISIVPYILSVAVISGLYSFIVRYDLENKSG